MSSIEKIKAKLNEHPEIKFEVMSNFLCVPSTSDSEFDVAIEEYNSEITITADGNWHEHYRMSEEDEAVDVFGLLLSPGARLQITMRGNTQCKWELLNSHIRGQSNKYLLS